MSVVSPDTIKIGDTVRFNTISPHDTFKWCGVVRGIVGYEVARTLEDIDSYYNDVKRVHRDISAKESMKYLLLAIDENNTGTPKIRVFAVEWINTSTFEIVSENTHTDIRIYDIPESKLGDIVNMIRSAGYVAEKIIN